MHICIIILIPENHQNIWISCYMKATIIGIVKLLNEITLPFSPSSLSLLLIHRSILQEGVNSKGLSSVASYVENYKKITSNTSSKLRYHAHSFHTFISLFLVSEPVIKQENLEVRQMFKQLKETYDAQKSKNVEFLIKVQQVRNVL